MTWEPIRETMPAPSWPRTAGNKSGMDFSRENVKSRSHRPVALICTSTSSGRNVSSSWICWYLNDPPGEATTKASVSMLVEGVVGDGVFDCLCGVSQMV